MTRRRIIVNNDYYNIFQINPPVEDQDILDAVDRIAGGQVDTLTLELPAVLADEPMIDPDLEARYQHPVGDRCMANLRALEAAGRDPWGMILERAHAQGMSFFASLRMNDTHYKDQPFSPFLGQFYYDHLDDRLGEPVARTNTEFDYRKSAVREYFLAHIRECLERYDIDGLELNFTRNCRLFPADHAEECAPILTQFVRTIRRLLDEHGQRRGKSMHLCAMVPCSILGCRHEGVDLTAMARLGLIDSVAFSSPFLATLDHDIADAKRNLAGVQVYAGCDRNLGFGFDGASRVVPMQAYRAMASNYLRHGADGIHLFNVMSWTMNYDKADAAVKRDGGQGQTTGAPIDYDRRLIHELGDMDTLADLDKLYIFAPNADSENGSLPIVVPAKGEASVRLRIGDDIAAAEAAGRIASIELQTVSPDCTDQGNYTVCLNGIDLARQYAFVPYADSPEDVLLFPEPGRRGALPERKHVRRHRVRANDLFTGVNHITIRSYRAPMTISDVEIAIRYHTA